MQLSELRCDEFTEKLASGAPVPGGGGAAALMGALGAALCAMAGNLTVGKPRFTAAEGELRELIGETEKLRRRFLELIDADAEAFAPLAAAYALPKDDPDSAEELRRAALLACTAPLEMMRCACRAIELLERMEKNCSRLMLSDVGCGALAAKAALEAAALNVFVNTRTLPTDPTAQEYADQADAMLKEYRERAQRVSDGVLEALRGRKHG